MTGKERTLYGFVASSSVDANRTLFPTEAMLEEYLDHWTGEWNERCETIFEDIWSNMHTHNVVTTRTLGRWKQILEETTTRAKLRLSCPPKKTGKNFKQCWMLDTPPTGNASL
jgi:hypothetical protein